MNDQRLRFAAIFVIGLLLGGVLIGAVWSPNAPSGQSLSSTLYATTAQLNAEIAARKAADAALQSQITALKPPPPPSPIPSLTPTPAPKPSPSPTPTPTPTATMTSTPKPSPSPSPTPGPPSAPTNLTATVGSMTITLSWSAVMPIAHYNVYRNGALIASPAAPPYVDAGLVNGTSYSYQVSAVSTLGVEGPLSSVIIGTPSALARPWAAPVTTAIYTVPGSIDPTGSTDVSAALNAFVAGVPNGSIIQFPTNAVYRMTAGIGIGARNNLIFEGNGSTIRTYGAGTDQTTSDFLLGWAGYWTGIASHITIHDFVLQGSASPVGVGGQGEEQAAVKAHSANYIEIYGNTVRGVTGDAFQFEVTATNSIWVHDNTVESAGRNGVTVGGGSTILVEHNAFVKIGYITLDIEPTPGYPTVTSGVIFRNNNPCHWSVWDSYGGFFFSADGSHTGYPIDYVTVTGNTVTGPSLLSQFDNGGGGTRNTNIVFTNNVSSNTVSGPVLNFAHVDGLTVTGNTQPLSSGSLASITDCTGVVGP